METYKVVKVYMGDKRQTVIMRGLSIEQAREVCSDPKTKHTDKDPNKTWMYVFYKE